MTSAWSKKKRFAEIDGLRMAYIEEGEGDPILFLHGNPTSSYLWRDVMPQLVGKGRLIAPDLIGMGDSAKLPDSGPGRYRFVEHARFLFALLDNLGAHERVTVVGHDWGGALGFHWAQQHPDRLRGIAFMETIVAPMQSWDEFPEPVQPVFQGFRSPAGEALVLEKNIFVEKVLPGSVLSPLPDEAMAEYRRPFAEAGEDRRPTLTWPRELPIEGEPADVVALVSSYAEWLGQSPVPKLFVNAKPGAILRGRLRELARSWPNLTEVTVPGVHFIQEDSGQEIGQAIAAWLDGLD